MSVKLSAPAGRFARCSSRSTRPKGSTLLASRRAAARVWLELRGVRVWLEPRRGWIVSLGARVSVAAATLRVVNAGGRSRTVDCPACSVRGRLRSRCTGRPTEARAQPCACGHHAGSFESVRLIEDGWRLDPSVPLASFVDGGCGASQPVLRELIVLARLHSLMQTASDAAGPTLVAARE